MLLSVALASLGVFAGADEELWRRAELEPPGPGRVRALLEAVQATPELPRERLLEVWNVAVDEARALRLAQGAHPLQVALHERYRAAWSASDLAQTLTLLGRAEEADALLAATIAQEREAGRPVAELWNRRALSALGFGDEGRARDYLGRALVEGSPNASLVLAWLDLRGGRAVAARGGFRASILSDQPSAWALRGWGSSLLPRAHAAPDPRTRLYDEGR